MKKCLTILLCMPVLGAQHAAFAGELAGKALDGCWNGTLTMKGETVAISVHLLRRGERLVGLFDVPAIGHFGRAFETVNVVGPKVSMSGGKGRHRLFVEAQLRAEVLAGVWSMGRMSGPIALNRCTASLPPETIREDVFFSSGKIRLAGTLVKPAGVGPFPVIVWTHGSGKVTRDEWIYSRWVNMLARKGIASLIYDKRGCGESRGVEPIATVHDFAGDLLAGVALVKSRSEFDATRIGVAGLSLGGWVAPLAASESSDIALVIVESAPGVPVDEQDLYRHGKILQKKGFADGEVSKIIDLRRSLFRFYRTGEGKEAIESELLAAADEPWFAGQGFPKPPVAAPTAGVRRNLNRYQLDVERVWEKVRVPVLAVWGKYDRIVPSAKSRKIIGSALDRIGHKDVHLQVFSKGTHRLTYSRVAKDPWARLRIIPVWPILLSDWLERHVADDR